MNVVGVEEEDYECSKGISNETNTMDHEGEEILVDTWYLR
jgi:hypothetical protein